MTYNSSVTLRGVNKPIIASHSTASGVQKIHMDDKIDRNFVISIGNQSFSKGDIKYVDVQNDGDDSRANDQSMKDFYDEEKTKRNALVNKSPEYKASLLDMFKYLYKIAMDEEPTQEIMDKALKIQSDFFASNPKRTLCDLHLLKRLIPELRVPAPTMRNEFKVHLKESYIHTCEKAVYRDMQLAGQIRSGYDPRPYQELKGDETVSQMKDVADHNRSIDKELVDITQHALSNF